MVDAVVRDELIIDWDNLLDNLPDGLNFDRGDLPPVNGLSMSPDSGCSFSIDELERYLLNDDPAEDKDGLADEFLTDVLLDCFPGSGLGPNDYSPLSGSGSERLKESSVSPELVDAVTVEEEKEREKPQKNVADVMQTMENCAVDNDGNADDDGADADDDGADADDDPNAKKRKRQMRNRDAAVKSRERKKMYVRDLEMKSKYYEAERKRLVFLLQCCLAENQALRLSLHNSKAYDASRTKQESAVLLLESLLLGSLLGFLGIIYLLILPSQLLSTLETSLLKNVDNTERKSVAPRKAGTENLRSLFRSFMMSKRCKASRSRMKLGCPPSRGVVVKHLSHDLKGQGFESVWGHQGGVNLILYLS